MDKKPNFQLKILRAKNNLSQENVANVLNITKSTYNRKENGIADFTLSEIKTLSELFNTSPTDIFFTENVANKQQKQLI